MPIFAEAFTAFSLSELEFLQAFLQARVARIKSCEQQQPVARAETDDLTVVSPVVITELPPVVVVGAVEAETIVF